MDIVTFKHFPSNFHSHFLLLHVFNFCFFAFLLSPLILLAFFMPQAKMALICFLVCFSLLSFSLPLSVTLVVVFVYRLPIVASYQSTS